MEYGFEFGDAHSVTAFNRYMETSKSKARWSERFSNLRARVRSLAGALRSATPSTQMTAEITTEWRHV